MEKKRNGEDPNSLHKTDIENLGCLELFYKKKNGAPLLRDYQYVRTRKNLKKKNT